jgi:diguanylate cyclase (GGDEF)-like protein/PAS domain S-box-containing protein
MLSEEKRLEALQQYRILDTPPEESFDRIVDLARAFFKAPVALISLVDRHRNWFKACYGIGIRETDRRLPYCDHTIRGSGVLVVPDLLEDDRFSTDPTVTDPTATGTTGFRFYAGAPLRTKAGDTLGTLCIIDTAPRPPFGPDETRILASLAGIVIDELELRLAALHRQEAEETLTKQRVFFKHILDHVPVSIAVLDKDYRYLYCNPAAISDPERRAWIVGKDDFEYCEHRGFDASVARLRRAKAASARETGAQTSWEEALVDKDGKTRHHLRNYCHLQAETEAQSYTLGYSIEITDQKQAEAELQAMEEATRQERERFQSLVETTNDLFWEIDQQGHFTYLNPRAEDLLGYPRHELLGRSTLELMTPAEAERFSSILQSCTATFRPFPPLEKTVLCKDGREIILETSGAPIMTGSGECTGYRGIARDITERKAAERILKAAHDELEQRVQQRTAELARVNEQLQHDALHDALTGLPNRVLFMDRLSQALRRYTRNTETSFAMLFLDFDRFKIINDSLGHAVGDQLLIEIAQTLQGSLRPADTVARLGGDEFTVLLEEVADVQEAMLVAERLQRAFSNPLQVGEHKLHISVSTGIVLASDGYRSADEIMRDADIAMYRAKSLGKARYALFDDSMRGRALTLMTLESDLRQAIGRDELRVFYQPIVYTADSAIAGFEALVRWQHTQHGLISPAEFIPIAEETGLITDIDLWVLHEACRQLVSWQEELGIPELSLSVNLSSRHFTREILPDQIAAILNRTGFPARNLRIEITESMLLNTSPTVSHIIEVLKHTGIKLYIDDFGTGYSSLSYLQRFPADTIKIDRSFIDQMMVSSEGGELVRTIIAMAYNLNMEVVAEGVETLEQQVQLQALGCTFSQGYFFSKPLPAASALDYLSKSSGLGGIRNPALIR